MLGCAVKLWLNTLLSVMMLGFTMLLASAGMLGSAIMLGSMVNLEFTIMLKSAGTLRSLVKLESMVVLMLTMKHRSMVKLAFMIQQKSLVLLASRVWLEFSTMFLFTIYGSPMMIRSLARLWSSVTISSPVTIGAPYLAIPKAPLKR